MSFTDNEPALTAGSVVAIVAAIVAVAIAFGAPITQQQKDAILTLVAAIAPIAVALLVRPHVTPVAKLEDAYGKEAAQKLTEGKPVVQ